MLASIALTCLCLSLICPDYPNPKPYRERLVHPRVLYKSNLPILDGIFLIKFVLSGLLLLNIFLCVLLSNIRSVKYVTYDTNLTLLIKHPTPFVESLIHPIYMLFLLLICDNFESWLVGFSIHDEQLFDFSLKYFYIPIKYVFYLSAAIIQVHYISLLPVILPLGKEIEFIISTLKLCQFTPPLWVIFLKILLSPDIEKNPGDFTDSFFSFANWNINSLAKDNFQRVQLLEAHNSIYSYDLISLTEVALNDSVEIPHVLLENYTFVSKNNVANTRHGGVGIFYKNSLPLTVRNDLGFEEALVVELNFGMKKIFFTVLYRSPSVMNGSPEFEAFLQSFQDLHAKLKRENPYAVFYAGDFNGHSQFWWPNGNTTPEGSKIEDLSSFLGLTQLISEPTNFEPHKTPTCIDLIFTDQPNLVLDSGTRSSLDPLCHHQITYCRFNHKIPPPPDFERKIWVYERANIPLIQKSISNFPWEQHFSRLDDVNLQVKSFNEIVLNIMSNFIPNKIIKVSQRDPPWIDKNLKRKLNRQQRLYRNYKKHGHKPGDKIRVDAFRDECNEAIRKAKEGYFEKLGNKLADPSTCQKSYWKIVNKVMNRCKAPKIPPLLGNDGFLFNAKEKAEEFIKYFSKQCKPLVNDSSLPDFNYLTDERLDDIPFHNEDIIVLIRRLNKNKSSGPDEISARMLMICDESIVRPLKLIFSTVLRTGIYPDLWKEANLTPIHKKGSKQLAKNYRPISLLPICSKLFEKIIFRHLYNHLVTNNLLTKNQSGFRPGDSTINQLIDLVNDIHKAFDEQKSLEVRAIFLDISKAFDKVWHDGLIFKLKKNGISGNVLNMFCSYLSKRKQRVVLNGSSSSFFPVESGVPQGSVLGPLLFLVYINDLEYDIKSKINFFADDTMLFSTVHDPDITADELNHDLINISMWAYQWRMSFNPEPTKQAIEVLFSHKRQQNYHPPLYFNGSIVSRQNSHKHLGLILDSKLTFSEHITEKLKLVKRHNGILKFLSKFLPLATLNNIYKMFIRPHLDYGDIIYHIPHLCNMFDSSISLNPLMEGIERIQYHAALAITGCWRGSNQNKLYEELGWETLSDRRWARRLMQMYKIHNNLTPKYLKNNLPQFCSRTLRNANINRYREFKCNSSRYKNSFFPDAIKSWNSLGTEYSSQSIGIFKKGILDLVRPRQKTLYGVHDSSGVKFIFQLRIGLSILKSHKKRHNFVDTPDDQCDCLRGKEDTSHFLFSCPLYAAPRTELLNSVSNVLIMNNLQHLSNNVKIYLYGHASLHVDENKAIILSTIKFIRETNRFS